MRRMVCSRELKTLFGMIIMLLLCASFGAIAAGTDQGQEIQRTYDELKVKKVSLEKNVKLLEGFLSKGQEVSQKLLEAVNGLSVIVRGLPAVATWEELDGLTRRNFDAQGVIATLRTLSEETILLSAAPVSKPLSESMSVVKDQTTGIASYPSHLEHSMKMNPASIRDRLEKDKPGITGAIGKTPEEVNPFLLQVKIRYITGVAQPFLEKLKGLDEVFSQAAQKARDSLRSTREETDKTEGQLQYLRRNYPVKEK